MPKLYESLKNSLVTEQKNLDGVSIRTAKLLIEDFEQSGVHLKEKEVVFIFDFLILELF